eukprot:scaffold324997_cov37-Prasinocladus_malaysianus.AAC.1
MGSPEGTCSLTYKPVDMPLVFCASSTHNDTARNGLSHQSGRLAQSVFYLERMGCAVRGQNGLASLQPLLRYDGGSQHSN